MLHSFVYSNLKTVYQSRIQEVKQQCASNFANLQIELQEAEKGKQYARLHCPNKCVRIQERMDEIRASLVLNNEESPVKELEKKCEPFLEMIRNQSMDLTDVERFYDAMSVVYRPNHYLNANTQFVPATHSNVHAAEINLHVCPQCDTPRYYDEYEAYSICPKCGNSVPFQRETNEVEETMQYTIQFEYDRTNHLREYMNQIIKAEENASSLPSAVVCGIKRQILKERITMRKMITPRRIKEWLKRDLRMTKYSEKVYSILFAVCKIRAPKIPKALEEKFYEMFEQVQKPFARHVPVGRVHFFNYGYLIRKFSELLGQRHLLNVFPILKGTDRVHFQDDIWKKCCADLGWKYIPSI